MLRSCRVLLAYFTCLLPRTDDAAAKSSAELRSEIESDCNCIITQIPLSTEIERPLQEMDMADMVSLPFPQINVNNLLDTSLYMIIIIFYFLYEDINK